MAAGNRVERAEAKSESSLILRRWELGAGLIAEWLGRRPFKPVWDYQLSLIAPIAEGRAAERLILVEHEPVITLGRRGREENLLVPPGELKRRGIDLYRIERGGDITYHGPGQLVGYPMLSLKRRSLGLVEYIRRLEGLIISVLSHFGISATTRPGYTGVWVEGRKICSIGVAGKRMVTFHGFALNVSTDLAHFRQINPCGLDPAVMTTMGRELGREVSPGEVMEVVVERFAELFG